MSQDDGGRSDEALAAAVAGGDDGALAELYDRYFPALYDFALRLTRDRNVAALVVQSAFLRAFQGLRAGVVQVSFKLHLFGGAHHDVAEQLRRRREPAPEADEAFTAADPARLSRAVAAGELNELAGIAWQAAREMKLNDYELLDLNARRRLDDVEIASILRTRREAIGNKLAAVVDEFESAYSARLLVARGRRSCVDLDFLIGDGAWSAALERRIQRHLASCQTCRETRGRHPGATEVLAALADAPAPPGWQATILDRLNVAVAGAAVAVGPVAAGAAPPERPAQPLPESAAGGGGLGDGIARTFTGGGARGPLLAALGGGLLAVVIVIGALCGTGAFDSDEGDETPIGSPTTTGSPTVSATPTTTRTASPTVTATFAPLPSATPVPTAAPLPTLTPLPTSRPTPLPRPTRTLPPPTATALPAETPTP